MVRQNQPYSNTKHFLLSACGGKWKEVLLVMFTVFVDDSGTAKDQPVTVAAALIVPSLQIPAIDRIWDSFRSKYGFTDFHSSVCAAKNYKTEFAKWDDAKVEGAFARARQITKKYASAAFSFAVCKDDFDAEAPSEWRKSGGENHYTWAFRTLMHHLIRWHRKRHIQTPLEFMFDWAEGRDKEEIEMLMDQFDDLWPEKFNGHYAFKKRKDSPANPPAPALHAMSTPRHSPEPPRQPVLGVETGFRG